MRHLYIICVFFLFCTPVHSQTNIGDTENAIMIGKIDMNTVIIHVYKNKSDQWPYKEFSIVTDEATGERKIIDSAIKGKVSKGGFIIINGLKTVEEIERMMKGQKVYEEVIIKDVDEFDIYEKMISDYLIESILEDAQRMEPTQNKTEIKETVTLDSLFEDGIFVGFSDNHNQPPSDSSNPGYTETITKDIVYKDSVLVSINYTTNRQTIKKNNEVEVNDKPLENEQTVSEPIQSIENDTPKPTLDAGEEELKEADVAASNAEEMSSDKTSKAKSNKKLVPFTLPKYKSKYGSRKSKKMSSRARPSKNKKTKCYQFKR